MTTENIYFSHAQIKAIEKAIKEMKENGLNFDSIKEVHNNGEGSASWITIYPTESKYLVQLGMKAAKYL